MKFLFPSVESPRNQFQSGLLSLSAAFLLIGCLVLTFAPAVRNHSWQTEYRWEQWVGFAVWLTGFALIYRQMNRFLPDRDPYLLPLVSMFTGWGLLTIYRLDPAFGFRQTAWLAICLAGSAIALRIPQLLQILRRYKYIWLISALLLTVLTFFFGTYPGGGGPDLWLGCCGVYLQPSEFLKFLLVIYLAAYLADGLSSKFKLMQLLLPTMIIAGLALLILVAQRDLGTASLFIILYTLVIYLASGRRRILLYSFLTILIAFIAGYLVFDVIQLRIEAWLNPWLDPMGRSYQIIQSIIAFANGGLFGRGIGLGSPGVVPVAHSDFIFTAIAEEMGLAGVIGLLILLAIFTLRGLSIALHAQNQFQRYLAAGLTAYLITQAILIMGGTMRLLPLTGVTLPFISYGGSSLVTSFFSVLLLLIISNQAEDRPASIVRSYPYAFVGFVFLVGLTLVGLLSGWWSIIRSSDLLERGDNPRRYISDQYVMRGTIFDRNQQILAQTIGDSGSLVRILEYPALSAVVGYSDPVYGQTGIEYSLDAYLRGTQGNTDLLVESTRLLYGQFPTGLDVRLSLDLTLQQVADQALSGYTGALILVNANSGEILAMSTSPTFDANQLKDNWEFWRDDQTSPLLNRAAMALYPPGTTTGGLVLARYLSTYSLSSTIPNQLWNTDINSKDFCAMLPGVEPTWGRLISSGCISPLLTLNQSLPQEEILSLMNESGLTKAPNISLETSVAVSIEKITNLQQVYDGSAEILVSPLQIVMAGAALSNGGKLISPQIATAYRSIEDGWLLIDNPNLDFNIPNFNAVEATSRLTQGSFAGWEIVSLATNKESTVAWYLAGTPPGWQGTPLTLVIALENATPSSAKNIGRQVFLAAIAPNSQK